MSRIRVRQHLKETVGPVLGCMDWDGAQFWGENTDLMGEHKGTLFTGGRGHREVNVLSGRDLGKSFLRRMRLLCPLGRG